MGANCQGQKFNSNKTPQKFNSSKTPKFVGTKKILRPTSIPVGSPPRPHPPISPPRGTKLPWAPPPPPPSCDYEPASGPASASTSHPPHEHKPPSTMSRPHPPRGRAALATRARCLPCLPALCVKKMRRKVRLNDTCVPMSLAADVDFVSFVWGCYWSRRNLLDQ
jgi:hypothetical protein